MITGNANNTAVMYIQVTCTFFKVDIKLKIYILYIHLYIYIPLISYRKCLIQRQGPVVGAIYKHVAN